MRVKPSFTHTIRRFASVMTTALVVRRATSASRSISAREATSAARRAARIRRACRTFATTIIITATSASSANGLVPIATSGAKVPPNVK